MGKEREKYGLDEEEQKLLIFLEKIGNMSSLMPCKQKKTELF